MGIVVGVFQHREGTMEGFIVITTTEAAWPTGNLVVVVSRNADGKNK